MVIRFLFGLSMYLIILDYGKCTYIESKNYHTVRNLEINGTSFLDTRSRSILDCLRICSSNVNCHCVNFVQFDCKLLSRNECSYPLIAQLGTKLGGISI